MDGQVTVFELCAALMLYRALSPENQDELTALTEALRRLQAGCDGSSESMTQTN